MNPTPSDEELRFPWEEEAAEPPNDTATETESGTEPEPEATPAPEASAEDDEPSDDPLDEAAARLAGRDRPIAQKEYYSISEVCDLVGLKPHVLRYWETQFQVLNPSKNRSGNRVYQRKEIRLVLLVKHLLYEEKYTVEGAKQKIEQMRRGGKLRDATSSALDAELLALLRDDLRQLMEILKPTNAD